MHLRMQHSHNTITCNRPNFGILEIMCMPVVYIYMSSECEACKLFRSFSLGAWHWLDSYGYACSKHIGGQLPHLPPSHIVLYKDTLLHKPNCFRHESTRFIASSAISHVPHNCTLQITQPCG